MNRVPILTEWQCIKRYIVLPVAISCCLGFGYWILPTDPHFFRYSGQSELSYFEGLAAGTKLAKAFVLFILSVPICVMCGIVHYFYWEWKQHKHGHDGEG